MNILLDYFFPITAITPTPAASTAFLKQACVVGKGGSSGVLTLCTSVSAAQALVDSAGAKAEIAQLFAGGVSRCYVLQSDDLDLADALEGHESDFFTLLITSDYADEEIGSVTSAAVKASKKIQDITFEAKTAGVAGNSTTINYNTGGTAGSEVVTVVGTAISIAMQDGVSTATQIKTAIDNSVPAAALVTVSIDSGDESDVQAVFGAAIALENGADAVVSGDIDVGDFKGVIGVSSDDDDFLADQAAIANRAAFHTTTTNKAKNMFYAFGKLLSNYVNWLNQQYISMQVEDDVATLGQANALFDDKINFVISDSEFSNRLALFVAGGKAIVAPYIVRNLEIDLQSKALQYVSGNQPGYTKTQAALLEDELQKVVDLYITRQWIEVGKIDVLLEQDNFIASGYINIREPKALWRVFGELRQTL